ncbi:hypothetical protein C8J56DRAFT_911343 [Mycena floridula]|nr:hypothetical protein C8J56DRAFT_911343 [Mycena floridula]
MLSSAHDSQLIALPLHDAGFGRPGKRQRNWTTTDDNNMPRETNATAASTARISRQDPSPKNRQLSCKECRRLKLKCDRVFPCSSCTKRGCADICPDGALTSGRGSRFILANTEVLHERCSLLSDRVRHLELALQSMQSNVSPLPHPLLAPELLKIKISQDLYSTPQNSNSAEASGSHQDDSLRISVGALSLSPSYRFETENPRSNLRESPPPHVHPDVLQLSTTFPFPWVVDIKIRKHIRDALPPRETAMVLCQAARSNALWQYNLDASPTFLDNLLHACYSSAIEQLSPRRLALLLMVLSIGSLVDLNTPLGTLHGEAYHHLARASVCEIPLMEEPDFDTLHALFFMVWYHLIFSDNNKAVGYAWNLLGFVAKLAQGLGLHRDGSRIKLIPEEHEKRQLVFWELLNLDCRMSLSLGRPPSIHLAHVDIKPPSYSAQGMYVPREELIYHSWKNSFLMECLNPVLEVIIAVRLPEYPKTLELDAKLRNFPVPTELDARSSNVAPRFLNMQRAFTSSARDIALLQLHRKNFTETMNGPESFTMDHQYAPSVLATYLSVSSLITAIETLYEREQQICVRFLCFWFNAFSAAVTLSLFVVRAPSSPLAPFALQDLERVSRLFHRAASILPFSGKSLPAMDTLAERARNAYMQWRNSDHGLFLTPPVLAVPLDSVPASFASAHPYLCQYVQQLRQSSSGSTMLMDLMPAFNTPSVSPYLPDIYHFSSNGIGLDQRYSGVAQKQPTPFMPSSPRVDGHESFNFDHGALTADLEETSYMAWF